MLRNNLIGKKGQVSLFVVVALVLVIGVGVYFGISKGIFSFDESESFTEVYNYYDECVKQDGLKALDIAGSQGGRIEVGEYVPGSDYAPFSSQLNFLGFPVPYWYYIGGNGLVKENVPSKADVEKEIENYLVQRTLDCDFTPLAERGFSVGLNDVDFDVSINDDFIQVKSNTVLNVEKDGKSAETKGRTLQINSNFGKMLTTAQDLYEKQINEAILENYSVDVLRLYAPVDGVEIQCSPKIWKAQEVVDELQNALQSNINSIKFNTEKDSYFSVNYQSEFEINTLYSRQWPWKVEVYGAEDGLMIAEPVGNQNGMGLMGFCYVPYHYVYDVSYPVMFQISSGEELFQFPVAVVIDKNVPRQAEQVELFDDNSNFDLCKDKTQDIQIRTFDSNLNSVEADLSYECFNQKCALGKTNNGVFSGKSPACVNGRIIAKAEGYQDYSELFSSNEESSKDLIMDKLYDVDIEVSVSGKNVNDMAIVVFNGKRTAFASLPDNNKVRIAEGSYNVSVYIYSNSSLKIPESKKTECREVFKSGIQGALGFTEEKCFDIVIPATNLDFALVGGGKSESYVLASQLESGKIKIDADSLPLPDSIEKLQQNYATFETLNLEVGA
ncbi:MAG: hypothetical protein AABW82_04175 [Nanoarchaeota archaeon]